MFCDVCDNSLPNVKFKSWHHRWGDMTDRGVNQILVKKYKHQFVCVLSFCGFDFSSDVGVLEQFSAKVTLSANYYV